MDKTAIYHKTARGTEAIAKRSVPLTPRLRSMLILVDGHRSCAELLKLAQGLGEGGNALEQLVAEGLIEPAARATPAAAPAVDTGPASQPPASGPLPLPQAKRLAVRRLTDLLGPSAEELCIRIEAVHTDQELRAALKRAEGILRQFLGGEKAERFMRDMEAQRPS